MPTASLTLSVNGPLRPIHNTQKSGSEAFVFMFVFFSIKVPTQKPSQFECQITLTNSLTTQCIYVFKQNVYEEHTYISLIMIMVVSVTVKSCKFFV